MTKKPDPRHSHREYIAKLLEVENENLRKMHEIVLQSLEEEEHIIDRLVDGSADAGATFAQKVADKFTSVLGSWNFIIYFCFFLISWITINLMAEQPWDEYPFILLNLFLSFLAGAQAPIIMMSQNRQAEKDKFHAENDYLVNLKTEIQIRELKQKLDLLIVDYSSNLVEIQTKQMEGIDEILSVLGRGHRK
jgi:uncharacterized membrane protein